MNKTTYYNLNKPDYSDPADIRVLNLNSDVIDQSLHEKQDVLTAGTNITITENVISSLDQELTNRVSTIEGKEAGWDAKYDKPSSGIPKSDLASAVQTSLGKADTSLQSWGDMPIATSTIKGGVMPVDVSEVMIQSVGVASDGKLFTIPYDLPIATNSVLGGIKPDVETIIVDDQTGVASISDDVQRKITSETVTISNTEWDTSTKKSNSHEVTGLTSTSIVICDSGLPYVKCIEHTDNKLVFGYTTTSAPSDNIDVKVVVIR